jgi:endonuclease YncB( thermonuclease family)
MRLPLAAFVIALLLAASAAHADVAGEAEVIDGETLIVVETRLRLEGITTPKPGTQCRLRGKTHDCGRISTTALMDLTAGVEVICRPRAATAPDGTRYALCRAGGYDLSEGMVYTGWAEADRSQKTRYTVIEAEARQARRGMWRRD